MNLTSVHLAQYDGLAEMQFFHERQLRPEFRSLKQFPLREDVPTRKMAAYDRAFSVVTPTVWNSFPKETGLSPVLISVLYTCYLFIYLFIYNK